MASFVYSQGRVRESGVPSQVEGVVPLCRAEETVVKFDSDRKGAPFYVAYYDGEEQWESVVHRSLF